MTLHAKRYMLNAKRGFTLVELVVILGILTLLLSLTFTYTQKGSKQIILFQEEARFVQALLRARSLGTQLFKQDASERVCGYGISIQDNRTYVLFKDIGDGACPGDKMYTGLASELIETFSLPSAVRFNLQEVNDIFFLPPNPEVYFNGEKATVEKRITLALESGQEVMVSINQGGQIVTGTPQ